MNSVQKFWRSASWQLTPGCFQMVGLRRSHLPACHPASLSAVTDYSPGADYIPAVTQARPPPMNNDAQQRATKQDDTSLTEAIVLHISFQPGR